VAALGSAGIALANVRVEITSTPYYARIAQNEIYHDGVWAAIAFYHDPACVPSGFNLLEFFDPAAVDCESFLAGFCILGDAWAPIQAVLNNTAPLPIWFVPWTELQAAIDDGVLTIDELAGLPSLAIGYATSFKETLHPFESAEQTMISIVASGLLEDGRGFVYQATGTKENNRLNHVKIEFK